MEYRYLFHEISEQRRSEIAQMSVAEANKKIVGLDQEWTGNCRTGIQQAQKAGNVAFQSQKAGAYNQLLFKLGDALDCIQEKDYIQQTKTGAAQNMDSYMDCLSMVSDTLKDLDDDTEKEAFTSENYRALIKDHKRYHELQKTSLKGLLLCPILCMAFWLGMYKLFTMPFMADFLAREMWENIGNVILAVLIIALVILFICTLGFFMGGALGVALSYVVAAIAKYGTMLILKLVPGIAPAFENAPEQVYILFFPIFLILLLLTFLMILGSVSENRGAVGKKKKLEDQLSKIRGRFSGLEREHQIYGLIVELAELCKTYARDKGSAGNLRKLSWQDATKVTDQIIQYFRPVRNGYDDAMKTLVDLYKQSGR